MGCASLQDEEEGIARHNPMAATKQQRWHLRCLLCDPWLPVPLPVPKEREREAVPWAFFVPLQTPVLLVDPEECIPFVVQAIKKEIDRCKVHHDWSRVKATIH